MAAADNPLSTEELLDHAREFVFHLAADETEPVERERNAIAVCWRFPGAWVVSDREGSVLNRNGQWEWEPQPSSRSPEFLQRTLYNRGEAIRRALATIDADRDELTSNGFAVDAWGIVAYNAARHCARTGAPEAITAWQARLGERDRAAFDHYLATHRPAAPQEQG